jgi:ADP-ribosylglycohydrolase
LRRDFLDIDMLSRAQGCLLGQLAGDSLGSVVEFRVPDDIRREYPKGVRELADGGTWNTIAGQPTDDSEMALSLARMLADQGRCDHEKPGKRTSALTESIHTRKEIFHSGHPTNIQHH